jgi:MFS family permease
MRRHGSDSVLVAVLVMSALTTGIISSVGAPLIPLISRHYHVPLTTAQWSLTITLLTGAVAAPVMGRLGDGPLRRPTLILGTAAVAAGCVVSALAPDFAGLLVGRGLQGIGLGLVPLTMATARDELPKARVGPTIGLLSVAGAAGVGAGYPISGLLADQFGLAGSFWFGAIFIAIGLVCVIAVIPANRSEHGSARLDTIGTMLLTGALATVLIAVAQGSAWGWRSPAIVLLLVVSIVLFVTWVFRQLHVSHPLVDLRLLQHRAVLTGNVCATVLGLAMYMALSAVIEFVQLPAFGFSASVVVAGLVLVPLSLLMLAASQALPFLVRRVSLRAVLAVGCLVVALSSAFFAVFHQSLWQAFVMMGVLGIGLGTTFAAIPGLIIGSVPPGETGSAMGFYQVVRYVGFAFGSALTASILAGHGSPVGDLPTLDGFVIVLWVAAAICVVAAVLAWVVPARPDRAASVPGLDEREMDLLERTEGEDLVVSGDHAETPVPGA